MAMLPSREVSALLFLHTSCAHTYHSACEQYCVTFSTLPLHTYLRLCLPTLSTYHSDLLHHHLITFPSSSTSPFIPFHLPKQPHHSLSTHLTTCNASHPTRYLGVIYTFLNYRHHPILSYRHTAHVLPNNTVENCSPSHPTRVTSLATYVIKPYLPPITPIDHLLPFQAGLILRRSNFLIASEAQFLEVGKILIAGFTDERRCATFKIKFPPFLMK